MRTGTAITLAALALVVSGCGSGVGKVAAPGDAARGKQLFLGQGKCSSCHTLAEAKAIGTIGPNLDAAFGSDRAQGFKESTIRQVVADQIRFAGNYGPTGPTMPVHLVTGAAVDDVATYVAKVAGQTGVTVAASSTPSAPAPSTGGGGALAAGKAAFDANGCSACHTLAAAGSTGKIGPDLDKLKAYAQKAGMPLDQFIRESIVKPNAYVEKGFPPGVMPQNFAKLPKSTLDALVKFLAASATG